MSSTIIPWLLFCYEQPASLTHGTQPASLACIPESAQVPAHLSEAAGRYLDFTNSLALVNPDTFYGLHAINLETLQLAAPPENMYSSLAARLGLSQRVVAGVAAALGLFREQMAALSQARAALSAQLAQASDLVSRGYHAIAGCGSGGCTPSVQVRAGSVLPDLIPA